MQFHQFNNGGQDLRWGRSQRLVLADNACARVTLVVVQKLTVPRTVGSQRQLTFFSGASRPGGGGGGGGGKEKTGTDGGASFGSSSGPPEEYTSRSSKKDSSKWFL